MLALEWESILRYWMKSKGVRRDFLWAPALDLMKYGKMSVGSGFCGVGLIQIYVNTDGNIYGCAANLKPSGFLGDVEKGLSVRKIQVYRELALKGNICSECRVHQMCQSRMCIMNNLAYGGDIHDHNPDLCYFEHKKINLWEKYFNNLEEKLEK